MVWSLIIGEKVSTWGEDGLHSDIAALRNDVNFPTLNECDCNQNQYNSNLFDLPEGPEEYFTMWEHEQVDKHNESLVPDTSELESNDEAKPSEDPSKAGQQTGRHSEFSIG